MKNFSRNYFGIPKYDYEILTCEFCKETYKSYIDPKTGKQAYRNDCACSFERELQANALEITEKIRMQQPRNNWLDCGIDEKQIQDLKNLKFYWVEHFKPIAKELSVYAKGFDVEEEKKGYIFTGLTGCGKSTLAKSMVVILLEKDVRALFVNIQELLDYQKRTFDDSSLKDMIPHVREAEFLVLDDLGVERKDSEWVNEVLYNTINYRSEREMPLIVTTNLSDKDIKERYDRRTWSRLYGLTHKTIKFPAYDFRLGDGRR